MGDAPKPPPGIDWVKLREDMEQVLVQESTLQRILRKFKENPFVPIGATVTVGALTYGLINFIRGKSQVQQRMMRLRVAAQLFTVSAAVGGIFFSLPKEKRNYKGLLEAGDRSNRTSSSAS